VYVPPRRWQFQAGALLLIGVALVLAAIVRTSTITLPPGLQQLIG
jgi:hypothetical protein